MKSLPWFRLYTETIDDEKLGLLAFEDRWHFIALLCLKGKGVIDNEPDQQLLHRKAALKMGLTCAELEKVVARLFAMNLIDKDTLQPTAWDERQMRSDSSAARVKAWRDRHKNTKQGCNVTVTAQEVDTDTDTEEDKKREEHSEQPAAPSVAKKANSKAKPTVDKPSDVPDDLWQDFLSVRKAKRAPLTSTAFGSIVAESRKAGLSTSDALRHCCKKNWQTFDAGWYAKDIANSVPAKASGPAKHTNFEERKYGQTDISTIGWMPN